MKRFINAVLSLLIIVLLGLGLNELSLYYRVDLENKVLKEEVTKIPKSVNIESTESEEEVKESDGLDPNDPFNRKIDFNMLSSINKDIVGWVYVPGTKVDYPILVGETDEEYLHKDYKGNYSYAGSVFGFSTVDLVKDSHICLFGHNMASRQMFGSLREYKSKEFGNKYTKAYIYTPDRTKECNLISVFTCNYTDSVFELNNNLVTDLNNNLSEFRDEVVSRSIYTLEVPENKDQIYTLVTCSGTSGGPTRLTVNFQVTKEKYIIDNVK